MDKVQFYFGDNSSYYNNDYGYKLLNFLDINNFNMLPNYPFDKSLDEMLLEEDEEIKEKVNEYCYYCLTNISKVIEENNNSDC